MQNRIHNTPSDSDKKSCICCFYGDGDDDCRCVFRFKGRMCFSFTLTYECFSRSLVVEDTLLSSSSSKSSSSSIFNVTWMNDEDVIIIKFNKSLMLVTDNILHTRMINIIY